MRENEVGNYNLNQSYSKSLVSPQTGVRQDEVVAFSPHSENVLGHDNFVLITRQITRDDAKNNNTRSQLNQ